jgi:hypothetical protein
MLLPPVTLPGACARTVALTSSTGRVSHVKEETMAKEEVIGFFTWPKKHLLILADTLEVGIEARASRNRHTGDLTDDEEEDLRLTIKSIRKLLLSC